MVIPPAAQEARRKGGLNKARSIRLAKMMPTRLTSIYDKLEQALGEVHDGQLAPGQGQAMSALAGALIKVLTMGEFEERLRRLEEARNERPGRQA